MADIANKYPENTVGKYYVDNQCIDCDLCRETAPDNFKRNDDGGYSFVYKQPSNADEEALVQGSEGRLPGRSDRRQRRLISALNFLDPAGNRGVFVWSLDQFAPQ